MSTSTTIKSRQHNKSQVKKIKIGISKRNSSISRYINALKKHKKKFIFDRFDEYNVLMII